MCLCSCTPVCACPCACRCVGSCVCARVHTGQSPNKKQPGGSAAGAGAGTRHCSVLCCSSAARGGWSAERLGSGCWGGGSAMQGGLPPTGTERGDSRAAGAQLVLLDTPCPAAPVPPSCLQLSPPRVPSLHVPRLCADLPAPAPWGGGCCTSGRHVGAGCAESCLPCSPPLWPSRGPAGARSPTGGLRRFGQPCRHLLPTDLSCVCSSCLAAGRAAPMRGTWSRIVGSVPCTQGRSPLPAPCLDSWAGSQADVLADSQCLRKWDPSG